MCWIFRFTMTPELLDNSLWCWQYVSFVVLMVAVFEQPLSLDRRPAPNSTLYSHTFDMLLKDASCRDNLLLSVRCLQNRWHLRSGILTFWELRYKHTQLTNLSFNSCVRSSSSLSSISALTMFLSTLMYCWNYTVLPTSENRPTLSDSAPS